MHNNAYASRKSFFLILRSLPGLWWVISSLLLAKRFTERDDAVDSHAYHDSLWHHYTAEQRAHLTRMMKFNRELVEAGEFGVDLSTVLRRLDPDPLRYLWVDEGGGRLGELIEEARQLLAAAPRIQGHVRYQTRRVGGESASRPTVAAADGRVLVAWISWHPGAGEQVVAAVFDGGGGPLVAPQPISGSMGDCFRPTALFDRSGRAWVFYARSEPGVGGTVAVYARCHDGGDWGPVQRVSTTDHPSFNQEVVAHDDGTVECVWQGRSRGGLGIYARRYDDGVWGEPRRLDGDSPGGAWDPTIAALPGKTSVYVWSAYVDGAYRLVARYGDTTGLAEPRPLTDGTDYALHPSLAVAGDASVWCAFDLVTIQGHGGSGPTALQPAHRLGRPPTYGIREAGAYVPPELRPNVGAGIRVVRIDEEGISEDPVSLAEGVEVNPSGMPRLAAANGGGITVAYRILRRLPLLQYYWEVAAQQIGPDGTGPVCTLADSDGGYEEPSVATAGSGVLVACTGEGRRDCALEWTEGFGGRRCVELASHIGEVAWHGLHGTGKIALAELPDVGLPRRGEPRPMVESSLRVEARPWIGENQDRYSTEVDGRVRTLFWGDLHRHSLISRCTVADDPGLDESYRYAWDVCDFDFWAVTDHSENSTAYQWWATKKIADLFHVPAHFVPFYGFEWTSELGHQNVIFGDVPRDAPIFSSSDEKTDRPDKLWASLRRFPHHPSITIPHHPGADMVSYDWSYHDSDFLRLVEVFQACRGNYEQAGGFRQYADATGAGAFVVDGLLRGHRFGLIGSTDHGYGASYVGVYADDLSREAVFAALRERRTVAATTRGIVVDLRIGETFMGGELREAGPLELEAFVHGYRDLARIDVVRDGEVVHSIQPELGLPAGWIAVPMRVEFGLSRTPRDWSGVLSVDGGEVLQTPWWSPEIREVHRSSVRWNARTHGFGGGGIYGPTRGGVELTVLGPPNARVSVKTVSGTVTATLETLRRGPVDADGPDAPIEGVLRIQPGTGGLISLGAASHRFSWLADPVSGSTWFYLRVFQVDGEMAWSSPIWVDPPRQDT